MKRNLYFLALGMFLLTSPVFAQDGAEKAKKKIEKKKEEKKKSNEKIIKEGEEFHMKIQTKETRKRMKESKRKAAMNNGHYREPFYKRWFRKKHR